MGEKGLAIAAMWLAGFNTFQPMNICRGGPEFLLKRFGYPTDRAGMFVGETSVSMNIWVGSGAVLALSLSSASRWVDDSWGQYVTPVLSFISSLIICFVNVKLFLVYRNLHGADGVRGIFRWLLRAGLLYGFDMTVSRKVSPEYGREWSLGENMANAFVPFWHWLLRLIFSIPYFGIDDPAYYIMSWHILAVVIISILTLAMWIVHLIVNVFQGQILKSDFAEALKWLLILRKTSASETKGEGPKNGEKEWDQYLGNGCRTEPAKDCVLKDCHQKYNFEKYFNTLNDLNQNLKELNCTNSVSGSFSVSEPTLDASRYQLRGNMEEVKTQLEQLQKAASKIDTRDTRVCVKVCSGNKDSFCVGMLNINGQVLAEATVSGKIPFHTNKKGFYIHIKENNAVSIGTYKGNGTGNGNNDKKLTAAFNGHTLTGSKISLSTAAIVLHGRDKNENYLTTGEIDASSLKGEFTVAGSNIESPTNIEFNIASKMDNHKQAKRFAEANAQLVAMEIRLTPSDLKYDGITVHRVCFRLEFSKTAKWDRYSSVWLLKKNKYFLIKALVESGNPSENIEKLKKAIAKHENTNGGSQGNNGKLGEFAKELKSILEKAAKNNEDLKRNLSGDMVSVNEIEKLLVDGESGNRNNGGRNGGDKFEKKFESLDSMKKEELLKLRNALETVKEVEAFLRRYDHFGIISQEINTKNSKCFLVCDDDEYMGRFGGRDICAGDFVDYKYVHPIPIVTIDDCAFSEQPADGPLKITEISLAYADQENAYTNFKDMLKGLFPEKSNDIETKLASKGIGDTCHASYISDCKLITISGTEMPKVCLYTFKGICHRLNMATVNSQSKVNSMHAFVISKTADIMSGFMGSFGRGMSPGLMALLGVWFAFIVYPAVIPYLVVAEAWLYVTSLLLLFISSLGPFVPWVLGLEYCAEQTKYDKYWDDKFPNYHYIWLALIPILTVSSTMLFCLHHPGSWMNKTVRLRPPAIFMCLVHHACTQFLRPMGSGATYPNAAGTKTEKRLQVNGSNKGMYTYDVDRVNAQDFVATVAAFQLVTLTISSTSGQSYVAAFKTYSETKDLGMEWPTHGMRPWRAFFWWLTLSFKKAGKRIWNIRKIDIAAAVA